jgi:hypothetical protein
VSRDPLRALPNVQLPRIDVISECAQPPALHRGHDGGDDGFSDRHAHMKGNRSFPNRL